MILRPFFRYYGGKWRAVHAGMYPQPRYGQICEPFAGAAGYSLHYAHHAIELIERDPVIAGIWRTALPGRTYRGAQAMTIDTKRLREPRRVADMLGKKFNRLLVVERAPNDKHNHAQWRCRCDCGAEHITSTQSLKSGHVKSCGCWQREHSKHRDTARHGHARRSGSTRTYKAWRNMLARCEDPTNKRYARYGGRGIAVCERWHAFELFLSDMGECPPELTIERVNNDGNYEPLNCKWATRSEQQANKSRSDRCRRGHPYPVDVRVDAKGARVCRICVADNARARRAACQSI